MLIPAIGRRLAALSLAALLGAVGPALAQSSTEAPANPPKWGPYVDFQIQPGTQQSLGESDLFAPLLQNDKSMLFTDLRGRLDDNGDGEGNFGLGVRHMLDSGWNLGTYGFFDRRYTTYNNAFDQVTIGAEALSLDWDLRANGYVPVGTQVKSVDSLNQASIVDSSVVIRAGEEVAMGGFDSEVGWRVPLFAPDAGQQLRVYAGGYRFSGNDVPVVAGPRLRLDLIVDEIPSLWAGSRLELGGEVQHDQVRGTQYFASLRLRVPLSFFGESEQVSKLTAMERRMEDPIVRDVDIVSQAGTFGPPQKATTTSGGAITVMSSATTSGADLPTALTDAGANSTVILSGSFTTSSQVTLQSGQSLIGSGSVTVKTASGTTATLAVSSGASITGNIAAFASSNYTIVMASNSTLSGMTINNTSNVASSNALAVQVSGVSGAKIIDNTINVTQNGASGVAHGIDILNSASNITVSGNTITVKGTGTSANTIGVQVNDASATVTGNTLRASGGSSNNDTLLLNQADILSGSSGNVANAGSCNIAVAGTGSTVTFTNASACGP